MQIQKEKVIGGESDFVLNLKSKHQDMINDRQEGEPNSFGILSASSQVHKNK